MTTAKLFFAGALSAITLSLIGLGLSSFGVVISSGVLLLTIAGMSFLAGWFVDEIDSHFGIKDNVKSFLKEAFPDLTVENAINKMSDQNQVEVVEPDQEDVDLIEDYNYRPDLLRFNRGY